MSFLLLKKKSYDWGESLALKYLKQKGYRFIERNFFLKIGEIDLIFSDHNTLVFIEVKRRRSFQYGYPYEAVTKKKQKKIIEIASYYIQSHQPQCSTYRFDIVSILGADKKTASIEHFQDAFDGRGSPLLF